jgi:hypothetical protein
VELLLAVALLVIVGFASVGIVTQIGHAANRAYASARGAGNVDRELEVLRGDAATAFAVFVPGGMAPEVDFYAKTDAGLDVFWRYAYNAAAGTLQRADYDANGVSGMRNVQTGVVDPTATYPPLRDVTAFSARTLAATELGSRTNPYGAVSAALIGSGAKALPVSFDNGAVARPDLYGGNGVVQVQLTGAGQSRTLHLLAAALPTGFTVHALPVVHGIVYRIDQTHRFWFGLAQVSHTWIDGHVDVSYDHWQTRTTWCDFNIYGGQHGIDPKSAQANYNPDDYNESFAGLLAQTQSDPNCGVSPPGPTSPGGGPAFTPPPDIVDTPPPCFTNPPPGTPRCWPPNAPPGWAPSPLPSGLPPPGWCLTHGVSPACGRGL